MGSNQVCRQFDGDQTACESAFHIEGNLGDESSCWYDAAGIQGSGTDVCLGCGTNNERQGFCVNSCDPASCDGDLTRTLALGQNQVCRQFDGDQSGCEAAFHLTAFGVEASCWFDAAGIQGSGTDVCLGCGQNNEQQGICHNECDGNDTFWSEGETCASVPCQSSQVPISSPRALIAMGLLLLALVAVTIAYRYRTKLLTP